MEGTIKQAGKEYWWWSGPANDGAKESFCVHCRDGDYGVTRYMNSEPDEAASKATAKDLIPMVEKIS